MAKQEPTPWNVLVERLDIAEGRLSRVEALLHALCAGIELAAGYQGAVVRVVPERAGDG